MIVDKVKASVCLKMLLDAEREAKRRTDIINKHLEERMKQPYEKLIIPVHLTIQNDGTVLETPLI